MTEVFLHKNDLLNIISCLQLSLNNMQAQLVAISEAAAMVGVSYEGIEVYYKKRVQLTEKNIDDCKKLIHLMDSRPCRAMATVDAAIIFFTDKVLSR